LLGAPHPKLWRSSALFWSRPGLPNGRHQLISQQLLHITHGFAPVHQHILGFWGWTSEMYTYYNYIYDSIYIYIYTQISCMRACTSSPEGQRKYFLDLFFTLITYQHHCPVWKQNVPMALQAAHLQRSTMTVLAVSLAERRKNIIQVDKRTSLIHHAMMVSKCCSSHVASGQMISQYHARYRPQMSQK